MGRHSKVSASQESPSERHPILNRSDPAPAAVSSTPCNMACSMHSRFPLEKPPKLKSHPHRESNSPNNLTETKEGETEKGILTSCRPRYGLSQYGQSPTLPVSYQGCGIDSLLGARTYTAGARRQPLRFASAPWAGSHGSVTCGIERIGLGLAEMQVRSEEGVFVRRCLLTDVPRRRWDLAR